MTTEPLDQNIEGLRVLMQDKGFLPFKIVMNIKAHLNQASPEVLEYIASKNIVFVSQLARNMMEGVSNV
jgi:hypothetical protein